MAFVLGAAPPRWKPYVAPAPPAPAQAPVASAPAKPAPVAPPSREAPSVPKPARLSSSQEELGKVLALPGLLYQGITAPLYQHRATIADGGVVARASDLRLGVLVNANPRTLSVRVAYSPLYDVTKAVSQEVISLQRVVPAFGLSVMAISGKPRGVGTVKHNRPGSCDVLWPNGTQTSEPLDGLFVVPGVRLSCVGMACCVC